jgi:hypothetical protein
MKMNISDFYDLRSKFGSKTFEAYPLKSSVARRKTNELFLGDYDGIDFPVIFKQESGSRFDDLLNTGTVSLYLVSEKLKILLEKNGLTGWKTFEIKVLDKKGIEVNGYYGFTVTGRCGKIDDSKGELITRRAVPDGPLAEYRKGLYVGLDKWDGSDFFCPEESLYFVTTKKAVDIIKANKISNVEFKILADIERAVY